MSAINKCLPPSKHPELMLASKRLQKYKPKKKRNGADIYVGAIPK